MTGGAKESGTGVAFFRTADPVPAQLIDDHPDFDPDDVGLNSCPL